MNTLDLFRLDGKTALVTGARRGIGMALAMGLAEAGADIIGVSASMESRGSAIEAAVRAVGRNFTPYACDFRDRNALYAFIEQVKKDFPEIDILVNNAGTIFRTPAVTHPDEYWDTVIEVDLTAQFILTREIAKGMLDRGRGKIIFTASLLSFQGGINVPSYSASKGGIASLTKELANEWAVKGLHVNALAPGYIDTDIIEDLLADPNRNQALLSRIPAGRFGNPDDLKGPVVFLASAASDYLNGTLVTVDGGWMGR